MTMSGEHYLSAGPEFRHVTMGMYIGCLTPQPKADEVDAVITLAREQGSVEHGLRHRHVPIGERIGGINAIHLEEAVDWTYKQIEAERRILIRSDNGRQRPGLVAACTILRFGGSYVDAVVAVRTARVSALTDFHYLDVLKSWDRIFNPEIGKRGGRHE